MNEPLTQPAPAPPTTVPMPTPTRAALLLILAYLAFSMLLPLPRFHLERMIPPAHAALILVPTMAFMLLQLGLTRALVALRWPLRRAFFVGLAALAAWGLTYSFLHPRHGLPHGVNDFLFLLQPTLLGLLLTLSLAFFGTILARIIKEKNLLLPVALVAMPIDYVGAMTAVGFTHGVLKHAPKVVQSVSVPVPAVSSATSIGPIAFIGPGDVLFMALFFAVVQNFRLNDRGTFWWMYGLLTAAMLAVLLVPNFNVAALVPMGIAVLIANWRAFQLSRDELFALLYAAILVFAVVGGFYVYSHHFLFHGK